MSLEAAPEPQYLNHQSERLRAYLSPGNSTSKHSKLFRDFDSFSSNDDASSKNSKIFNVPTGLNILIDEDRLSTASFLPPLFTCIAAQPLNLRWRPIELLDVEIQSLKMHGNGFVMTTMTAQRDQGLVELNEAAEAEVVIKISVHGVYCQFQESPDFRRT